MYEVELKVKTPHDPVRARLSELNAHHTETVEQTDTYYDAPHRNFETTDEALRIRTERTPDAEETATLLTYKGPLVDAHSKTRTEIETGVENHTRMDDILDALGFTPATTVEKTRDRYAHGDYIVSLDSVSGLGEFVEVETEAKNTAAIETARDGATTLLRELDLDPDNQIRTSYLGLLSDNYQ